MMRGANFSASPTVFGLLLVTACGGAQFSSRTSQALRQGSSDASKAAATTPAGGSADAVRGASLPTASSGSQTGGLATAPGSSSPATAASPTPVPAEPATPGLTPLPPAACPVAAATVLVLDFKSGWWAGDGGTFFQTVLHGLSGPCVGTITFEYHHITGDGNTVQVIPQDAEPSTMSSASAEAAVKQSDFNTYTEIWVLSGSGQDPDDIPVSGALFTGIAKQIAASRAHLLIGSGNGNLTHANALLSLLGSTAKFTTTLKPGPVVDATGSFTEESYLTVGTQLQSHPLFGRGVLSIADDMQTETGVILPSKVQMHSDSVSVDASFDVIGDNTAGSPVIAVSADAAPRRIILDAGLQRFYAIKDATQVGTTTYLQNILLYLARP